jgi:catechol 2,3-dioxygenase
MDKPVTPWGINHIVLNVRDIEESHRFWTEVVGLRKVGEIKPTPKRPNPAKMRFYSGDKNGYTHHHDLALVENRGLPEPPKEWGLYGMPMAINHIAITMPTREAWLTQMEFLRRKGVKFDLRIEHGMTHSVYIHDPNGYGVEFLYDLPKEVWQGDIDGALNYAERLPTEGTASLDDRVEGIPTFGPAAK